ncbi:MAG TPA: hypothetical protein V6D19_07505 [Stenomitos sp.]
MHEPLTINPPRSLTFQEEEILKLLLSVDFPGREALLIQAHSVRVSEECKDCRSIKLAVDRSSSNAAIVKRRIPIEAETQDVDNMKIHILLHVVQGYMDEIEIYREDLQKIIEVPKPNELVLINLDADQG